MARTRTTIRRVDPWSVLKFGFVANLVLLGVYLLVGAVAWAFVRRLQLVETVCDLARSVGYRECAVDGQALFDTMLVLGLLGVVIQTGVFVFLAFLANLIFDLVGGIAITLDDDRATAGVVAGGRRRGVGSTVGRSRSTSTSSRPGTGTLGGLLPGGDRTGRLEPATGPGVGPGVGPGAKVGATAASTRAASGAQPTSPTPSSGPAAPSRPASPPRTPAVERSSAPTGRSSAAADRRSASAERSNASADRSSASADDVDDEPLFGGS